VVLFPDKDAIVVFTANARNTQNELNLMHDYLFPAIQSDKALASDPASFEEMQRKVKTLNISTGEAQTMNSEIESRISMKEFALTENEHAIQSVYFAFNGSECTFAVKRDNQVTSIKAGSGTWRMSNTVSASLLAPPRDNLSKSVDANYTIPQPVMKLGAAYAWRDSTTLEITGRFVEESLRAETIVCSFSEQSGALRLTIETKEAAMPSRMPVMRQPVVLRGSLIEIL
jgi:hypothetical protein